MVPAEEADKKWAARWFILGLAILLLFAWVTLIASRDFSLSLSPNPGSWSSSLVSAGTLTTVLLLLAFAGYWTWNRLTAVVDEAATAAPTEEGKTSKPAQAEQRGNDNEASDKGGMGDVERRALTVAVLIAGVAFFAVCVFVASDTLRALETQPGHPAEAFRVLWVGTLTAIATSVVVMVGSYLAVFGAVASSVEKRLRTAGNVMSRASQQLQGVATPLYTTTASALDHGRVLSRQILAMLSRQVFIEGGSAGTASADPYPLSGSMNQFTAVLDATDCGLYSQHAPANWRVEQKARATKPAYQRARQAVGGILEAYLNESAFDLARRTLVTNVGNYSAVLVGAARALERELGSDKSRRVLYLTHTLCHPCHLLNWPWPVLAAHSPLRLASDFILEYMTFMRYFARAKDRFFHGRLVGVKVDAGALDQFGKVARGQLDRPMPPLACGSLRSLGGATVAEWAQYDSEVTDGYPSEFLIQAMPTRGGVSVNEAPGRTFVLDLIDRLRSEYGPEDPQTPGLSAGAWRLSLELGDPVERDHLAWASAKLKDAVGASPCLPAGDKHRIEETIEEACSRNGEVKIAAILNLCEIVDQAKWWIDPAYDTREILRIERCLLLAAQRLMHEEDQKVGFHAACLPGPLLPWFAQTFHSRDDAGAFLDLEKVKEHLQGAEVPAWLKKPEAWGEREAILRRGFAREFALVGSISVASGSGPTTLQVANALRAWVEEPAAGTGDKNGEPRIEDIFWIEATADAPWRAAEISWRSSVPGEHESLQIGDREKLLIHAYATAMQSAAGLQAGETRPLALPFHKASEPRAAAEPA